ncbi:A1 cistron-splicing factor [Chytriomyces sp. MP71]|nr:A1 cistron-splicing factor [Chytriomyces sp. MP71]
MEIEPDLAKKLLATGAMLLFLDAPLDTTFGIDLNEWQTGPRFKGLKLIPPGFHFVFYSAKNSTGESGLRTGFFKFFDSKEIYVTQWDAVNEDIREQSELDPDHVHRLRYNILEFEPSLGAYPLIPHPQQPLPTYQKWLRLSSFISRQLVDSLIPSHSKKVSSLVSVSHFSDLDNTILKEAAKGMQQSQDVSMVEAPSASRTTDGEQQLAAFNIKFTPIDLKRSYPPNATPDQITKYWLDKSYLLTSVLASLYKGDYRLLLGEIQFSFILFLVGQVYDGLEQWKCLVQMVCGAREAIKQLGSSLFLDFIDVLHSQLAECPEDFFVDALSSSNFLRSAILLLVSNIRDPDTVDRLPNPQLETKINKFVKLVSERFSWDVEEAVQEKWLAQDTEEGEFAPQVCE